ncbi:alpha/beta hydrolase fold domain-containing protein [Jatrophihabitans endophyticus]|uniref:alpha/beta hydrolase fold domain-containing protein n=1 Tax=Jatrophihabitans endophyticus TaxID=1206085 RepID=UPI0019F130DA|nr:alpha/beta hydrolase fold domain-containing protein [Jatrophihabitans endophyticus]MBE7187604.1 alpha/beta hydrolase fold domain-containing protein [Jatrophihabitans endophyticus]
MHGGGFTSGGLDQRESDAPARELAAHGRRVRTVDYRLAPSMGLSMFWRDPDLRPTATRFPAALHDVEDAASDLAASSKAPIHLGGASAGANLAAATAVAFRDRQPERIRCLALAYGIYHAQLPDAPEIENELRGALVKWAFGPAMVRRMNLNYVGAPDRLAPGLAFPGGTDLHALPPALVLDARNDRLRRSGHAFASELRAAGVSVQETVVEGQHAFLNTPKSNSFRIGVEHLAAWLRAHDIAESDATSPGART